MLVRLSWLPWLLWLALNGVQSQLNRRVLAQSHTTRTIKEPKRARQQHLASLAGAAFLLLPFLRLGPLERRWLPARGRWQVPGLLLESAGLGLALWARVVLGQSWTGRVALTEDQPLVTDGPYRLVRHPIYAGLLSAALGTAIVQGRLRGLAGFAIL